MKIQKLISTAKTFNPKSIMITIESQEDFDLMQEFVNLNISIPHIFAEECAEPKQYQKYFNFVHKFQKGIDDSMME